MAIEGENAVTPKIPFLENRLIGEVQFYLIENPFLKIEPPSARFPIGKPINLNGLYGTFLGTDHHFIHSETVRNLIISNCIEDNKQKYLSFSAVKRPDLLIQYMLDNHENEEGG